MCIEFGHSGFDRIRKVMSDMGYEYDTNSHANAFFVRRDVLAAINLRHLAKRTLLPNVEIADQNEKLSAELAEKEKELSELSSKVEFLQKRESELVDLYNSTISSKAWRFAQFIRRCVGRR